MIEALPISTHSVRSLTIVGDTAIVLGLLGALAAIALSILALRSQNHKTRSYYNKLFQYSIFIVLFAWILGFCAIIWFHVVIYKNLPLKLPDSVVHWLNNSIRAMNQNSEYDLPLIPLTDAPRYMLPPWLEGEKVYFWCLCFSIIATLAIRRLKNQKFFLAVGLSLFICSLITYLVQNPFHEPLPRFFAEITPFFSAPMAGYEKIGLFMRLYPRMIFYYNAHYMWIHPPLLFASYALVQMTFLTSIFMLFGRDRAIEGYGYACTKLAFFLLTIGMLLGYPWALRAWGPNWWWDPKIASSIMMWAVLSTFLHARLYLNKKGFWYVNAGLGILCFVAVMFTFLSSYFFPGEHTLQ